MRKIKHLSTVRHREEKIHLEEEDRKDEEAVGREDECETDDDRGPANRPLPSSTNPPIGKIYPEVVNEILPRDGVDG